MSSITLYSYRINELDLVKKQENLYLDNKTMNRKEFVAHKGMDNKFNNENVFEGWNCGKITRCGEFGQICGRFGVKGKVWKIKKTFNNLPAGKYSVELDFIKIDSWFVCVILEQVFTEIHACNCVCGCTCYVSGLAKL